MEKEIRRWREVEGYINAPKPTYWVRPQAKHYKTLHEYKKALEEYIDLLILDIIKAGDWIGELGEYL